MSTKLEFVELQHALKEISDSLLEIKEITYNEVRIFSSVPSLAKYLHEKNVLTLNDFLSIRGLISEINNNLLDSDDFKLAKTLVIKKLNDLKTQLRNRT